MRTFFVILFFLGFLSGSYANEESFLWKMAHSHRQEGNLQAEDLVLKKLLKVNPGHPGAVQRMKELDVLRKQGKLQNFESRLEDLQSLVSGELAVTTVKKGFKSDKEEAEYLENALKNKALTESQKAQMYEKLAAYYFKKAMKAIKEERIRVAIESLEKSIAYDDSFQLSYYELGFLYFRIRELQKGIENLEHFVKLQPSGILAKRVRETLLNQYMSIARTYYFQQDFKNCKPYLERIIRLNNRSPEADTALVYLMNLYFYQGMKHMRVDDFSKASINFFSALEALKEKPDLDLQLFAKLAKNAVDPFIKHAQKLFVVDKSYGEAFKFFQAVTWLVPGSAQSFLSREYMKEIQRINETATNPVVYFSNFIDEENQRFLMERRGMKSMAGGG